MILAAAPVHPPAPAWAGELLQVILLVAVGIGATLVVLARQPARQTVLISAYGLLLALLFFVLQAPDVTLSEITAGAVVLPLIILLALAKLKLQPAPEEER